MVKSTGGCTKLITDRAEDLHCIVILEEPRIEIEDTIPRVCEGQIRGDEDVGNPEVIFKIRPITSNSGALAYTSELDEDALRPPLANRHRCTESACALCNVEGSKCKYDICKPRSDSTETTPRICENREHQVRPWASTPLAISDMDLAHYRFQRSAQEGMGSRDLFLNARRIRHLSPW